MDPFFFGDQTKPKRGARLNLPWHVILKLVANSKTDRQVLPHSIVILNVPAELILAILDRRIADASRELSRPFIFERLEIGKLESPKRIRPVVAAVTSGLE